MFMSKLNNIRSYYSSKLNTDVDKKYMDQFINFFLLAIDAEMIFEFAV